CDWKGRVDSEYADTRQTAYVKPTYVAATPTDNLLDWFRGRGIPPELVLKHKIMAVETEVFDGKPRRAIAFPYYRNCELINVKYRTAEKEFRMEKGAELTLYGADDIESDYLVFCEGELDKLSIELAGYPSCVSVPNGAKSNLDILAW